VQEFKKDLEQQNQELKEGLEQQTREAKKARTERMEVQNQVVELKNEVEKLYNNSLHMKMGREEVDAEMKKHPHRVVIVSDPPDAKAMHNLVSSCIDKSIILAEDNMERMKNVSRNQSIRFTFGNRENAEKLNKHLVNWLKNNRAEPSADARYMFVYNGKTWLNRTDQKMEEEKRKRKFNSSQDVGH
jgi:hypothetical protein